MSKKIFILIAIGVFVIVTSFIFMNQKVLSPKPTPLPNQALNLPPPQAITSTQNYSWKDNYLIGEWSVYLDCPNTLLQFKPDGVVEIERCGSEGETLPGETGTYISTQEKVWAHFPESGDSEFTIIFDNNEWKLKSTKFDKEFLWNKTVR